MRLISWTLRSGGEQFEPHFHGEWEETLSIAAISIPP
jgi:hypothetical protein